MQVMGPATGQGLPGQGHSQVAQLPIPWRAPHRQVTLVFEIKGIEQLLTAHVLVAGGDVAFADAKLVCPAWDRVLVVAGPGAVSTDQVPGTGASAEGINL